MNQDEVKRNLLAPEQWLRMLLMAGYMLVVWVVGIALVVVIAIHTLIVLVTGELNGNLQRFGAMAATYLHQIVDFLVYATDEKPFPFSSFPDDGDAAEAPPTARPHANAASTAEPAESPDSSDTDDATPGSDDLDPERGGQNHQG